MDEHLDDELEIMSERSQSGRIEFSADVFDEPIKVLCKTPAITVPRTTTIGEAVKLMQERKKGALLVVENSKLVGIFTERDFLKKVGVEADKWKSRPVEDLMTPNPESLTLNDEVKFVINRMHVGGYRHVPIVNEQGEPLHLISLRDMLGFLLDHFPKLLTNISPRPARGGPPWGG